MLYNCFNANAETKLPELSTNENPTDIEKEPAEGSKTEMEQGESRTTEEQPTETYEAERKEAEPCEI